MTFVNSLREAEGRKLDTNIINTVSSRSGSDGNVGSRTERNVNTNFSWLWSVLVTLISFTTRSLYGLLYFTKDKKDLNILGRNNENSLELENQLESTKLSKTLNSFPNQNSNESSKSIMIRSNTNINTITNVKDKGRNSRQMDYFSKVSSYIPKCLHFQFHKKKLVLDLDETLISSSQRHLAEHDISCRVYIGSSYSTFFVKKRPHVDLFLETVSQWFELVIFTASMSVYANAVIDKLDPKRHINRRYYRQSCLNKAGCYVKDLQIVCRDLSKVVIIDNSPVAYSINKENGIPIDDWVGSNPRDQSLLNLLPLLDKLRHSDDVRHVLKTNQKISNYGGS